MIAPLGYCRRHQALAPFDDVIELDVDVLDTVAVALEGIPGVLDVGGLIEIDEDTPAARDALAALEFNVDSEAEMLLWGVLDPLEEQIRRQPGTVLWGPGGQGRARVVARLLAGAAVGGERLVLFSPGDAGPRLRAWDTALRDDRLVLVPVGDDSLVWAGPPT